MPIVGHKGTIADLQKLASRGALGHGYIFYGPAMVGKRTVALALARFIETQEFDDGKTYPVLQDAKLIGLGEGENSIGIDAVREVKQFLWQKPAASSRRTLIIDDADLLTAEAQNALLKIAEEPPASALIILVTSDIESLLPTLVSRLPKIYFGAVGGKEINVFVPQSAAKSLGKPGLAWRINNDKAFGKRLDLAQKFLKTPAASRKEFIKKIVEPDDFNLRNFLDAVIITLAWENPSKARAALWHKALALAQVSRDFAPNPRLQLESLLL